MPSRQSLMRVLAPLLLLGIVGGTLAFPGTGAAPAHAQGADHDYVDVALILEHPDYRSDSAREFDIVVMNHGSRTAYDIEVVARIVSPEDSSYFGHTPNVPVGSASLGNDGYSFRWAIPSLAGLQREEVTVRVRTQDFDPTTFQKWEYVHEFSGEITTSSFESERHKGNNAHRVWSMAFNSHTGDSRQGWSTYSVDVSADQRFPSPGDIVNFTITAEYIGAAIDQQVAIELTDGLAVDEDSAADPPRVVSYDPETRPESVNYNNGVFTIGTLKLDDGNSHSVTLPVRVSSEAVVNEQCLTATITGNPPPGTGPRGSPAPRPYDDDISDNVVKVCLGDQPVQPFLSDQVDAFTIYPCVGVTTSPCDSADDVRIRGVDRTTTPERLIDPDDVTVNIADASGRTYDGQIYNSVLQSVNSENEVSWQTATESDPDFVGTRKGVKIGFTRGPFNAHLDSWSTLRIKFTVEGADGPPPGTLHVRNSGTGRYLFALNSGNSWTASVGPFNLVSPQNATAIWSIEFEKLGVYAMEFSAEATHATETGDCDTDGDNDNDAFCASETYTFHVGPMADLAVEGGGASHQVATDQHALTIAALNNGPNNTGGAKVTGLPTGAQVIHISQGTYDGANGEWDVGELKLRGYYSSRGEPDPTLVLSASAGDTANVSISNSANYEVCVGPKDNPGNLDHDNQTDCEAVTNASWNSTPVYDYDDSNNTVTLTAQAGTGGGESAPTLQTPSVHTPSVGISWSEVDLLYGLPVKDYQVQWSTNGTDGWTQLDTDLPFNVLFDITIQSGQTRHYRVRAVNEAGVAGPWSAPVSALAEETGVPGVRVSVTELELAEGASGDYTVGLKVRPVSNLTVNIGVSGDVTANPRRVTFTPTDWETPRTVTLTAGQDRDGQNDTLNVTHSISTSDIEYARLTVPAVAVTVIDDDSDISIAASNDSINEGEIVFFTLTRQGNIQNPAMVNVNVTQRGNFLASGEAGQRTIEMSPGVPIARFPVTTDNDGVLESAGSFTVTVQSGTGYFVGSPSSVTVSVQDDDGVPGQPESLTAVEGDQRVALSWGPAPVGDKPVLDYSYRVRRSDRSTWDPDWTVLSGGSGRRNHTVTGLTNGQEYVIQVRARNETGNGAAAEVRVSTKAIPGRPDVTVTARHQSLLVTWDVPDTGGSPTTEYRVQWKSGGQSFETSRQATTTTREYTIPNLTNGTEYRVRVQVKTDAGWSEWSLDLPGTPAARPATSLRISTTARDGVSTPFRVTFSFTDQDHQGNRYGVSGFDVDDIEVSYQSVRGYEFSLKDFREEVAGFVYSARVDDILEGNLNITVRAGAAQSTHDGQRNTSATYSIQVKVPEAVAPTGTEIWASEMTVGKHGGNATGYIDFDLSVWNGDGEAGSLSDGDAATDDDNTFTYSGTNYTVGEVTYVPAWTSILFIVCPGIQGANAAFDLYLDDQVADNADLSLSFDANEVETSNLNRTIDGDTVTCVEYEWKPRKADWQKDGKVNVKLIR